MKKTFLTLLPAILAVLALQTCKKEKEEAILTLLGTDGGVIYFQGTVNNDISPTCGTASAATTSTGTGTGTGTSTGTSTGSTSTNIESYLAFKVYGYPSDAFIFTRYTHTAGKTKYTLSPSTTTISTCRTQDGISCNAAGALTCETADQIKCGGTKTFIFSQASQGLLFQATSGTIDWSQGFALDAVGTTVMRSNLSFNLVDRQGRNLKGDFTCTSSN